MSGNNNEKEKPRATTTIYNRLRFGYVLDGVIFLACEKLILNYMK